MNKKITLYYFLIALIVIISITDSSYAALTAKFDVDKTLAFWTPEIIKSVKPLIPKNIGFRNKTRNGIRNIKIRADNGQQQLVMPPFDNPNNRHNYPIGRLFSTDSVGRLIACTASMINTENGNIGITAAHCLFDDDGTIFNNMMFSPGYDSGIPGPLGLIPVEFVVVPSEYDGKVDGPPVYDYGFIRMNFNDPNGYKLQQYTGANGWRLNVEGDDILTAIFGYPNGGDMPNCERDGKHLCAYVGNVKTRDTLYVIPGVELGNGASGSPFIVEFDTRRNLGYTYSNYASHNRNNNIDAGPRYNPVDFNNLLEYVSNN